jgi:hypothetical protein
MPPTRTPSSPNASSPSEDLNNSGLALKEYLGLLAYRLRNWA